MKESFDYKSIRALAYFVPALLCVMTLRVGSAALTVEPRAGLVHVSLFQASEGFVMACQLMEYLMALACFICVYRLSDLDVWLDVSNTMFLCYMLMSTVMRVLEWMLSVTKLSSYTTIGLLITGLIPMFFLLLAVSFMLTGMIRLYPEPDGKDKGSVKNARLARRLWIPACFLLMLAELLLAVFILYMDVEYRTVIRGLSVGLTVAYAGMCIPLVLQLQRFCYRYYMYRYNNAV